MSASSLQIQPDWDKAILAKDKGFWFHIYEPDKTHYHKIAIGPESLKPDVENVNCRLSSPKLICLEDETRDLRSTFQCPDLIFSSIHKPQRQPTLHVNSFDVNCGGKWAVSASSDNVLLWDTNTGAIRGEFVGHVSEVYCCRFFPSGLVAVTGGSDMQLKIWSCISSECAATLKPGLGGSDPAFKNAEPGGHRTGVIDVDFIDRGKNIVSLDRGGWVRLWDVSTQLAISAISVVPGNPEYTNCSANEKPHCCVVKRKNWETPSTLTEYIETGESPNYSVLETSSSKPVVSGVTDKLVAVGTGCNGILSILDLTSPASRRQGPVLQLTLPGQSGGVTACCFPKTDSSATSTDSPLDDGLVLDEFGVIAGGENGEIACWDLRSHRKPLISYKTGKTGIVKLKTHRWSSHNFENASGDVTSVSAFTGLFTAYRDGRTTLQTMPPPSGRFNQSVLELTGPDIDSIKGLALLPSPSTSDTTVTAWTATNSGHFYCYRKLAVDCLFT